MVMGKKGQGVWTDGKDEAAIAEGVYGAYVGTNLRYSQVCALRAALLKCAHGRSSSSSSSSSNSNSSSSSSSSSSSVL